MAFSRPIALYLQKEILVKKPASNRGQNVKYRKCAINLKLLVFYLHLNPEKIDSCLNPINSAGRIVPESFEIMKQTCPTCSVFLQNI
jgi:hypothetical protein